MDSDLCLNLLKSCHHFHKFSTRCVQHILKSHHLASPRHPKVFHCISGHDLAVAFYRYHNYGVSTSVLGVNHFELIFHWPTQAYNSHIWKVPSSPPLHKPLPASHAPWGMIHLSGSKMRGGNRHWITEGYTPSNSPQNPIENI